MATASTASREKGNAVYKSVTEGLSPLLKKDRLTTSLRHYHDANRLAGNPTEKASACKNIAMASWKMADVISAREKSHDTVVFYYKEALKHFRDACAHSDAQSLTWKENVMTSSITCWMNFLEFLDNVQLEERIRYLETTVDLVVDALTRAQTHLEITRHFLHAAILNLHNKNYKKSLSMLKDCHYPLNEARRLGGDSVTSEVEVLEVEIFVQTCVTESVKARCTGDELLTHAVRVEEILNMDMIFDVLDWYRTAIVLTRERDMEMEAIAHSRLGQVYDQVLHMKVKAKEYFNRSLHLANLLVPRTFHNEDWHIAATATMKRYQREAVYEDEKKRDDERAKVKDEIKDDLLKLNTTFSKSTKMEFLMFIYKTYPPKHPKFTESEIPENPAIDEWKKLYLKAVVHYHPDKVDVEKHGLKWKVLSEEITKLINKHYESLKMAS